MSQATPMTVDAAIGRIDEAVADARRGLPDEVFRLVSRLTPLVNVDLLIRDGEGRTLLTWRVDDVDAPGWHIPGGILRFKETWAQRIAAVAMLELGTTVRHGESPLAIRQPISEKRTVRGHFISLLFRCELSGPPDMRRAWPKETPPGPGEWAWHAGCPADLLPVHRKIYGDMF